MARKRKFKQLQLSGEELDKFVNRLVDKLYESIWSDLTGGPGETAIKNRLRKSIMEALQQYAGLNSDKEPG